MNDRSIFLLLSRCVETQEVTLTVSQKTAGWSLEINYDYRESLPNDRFLGQTLFATRAELDAQLAKIIPSFRADDYLEIERRADFWRLRRPAGPRYVAIDADREVAGWCLNIDHGLGYADEGFYTREHFQNWSSLKTHLTRLVQDFEGIGYRPVLQPSTSLALN